MKPSPARSQGSEATQMSPGASSHSSVLGEDAGVPSGRLQQLPLLQEYDDALPCVLICFGLSIWAIEGALLSDGSLIPKPVLRESECCQSCIRDSIGPLTGARGDLPAGFQAFGADKV